MKNPLLQLGVAIAAGAIVACASTAVVDDDSFRTIARGYQSGIIGPDVEVARTQNEWEELWARHTSTELPRPELPPVDFDRDMVVFAAVGVRPTTGYAFEIERVEPQITGDLLVEALERVPAPDAILPQVVSQPFHVIAMRKRGGNVRLSTEVQGPSRR
jgi:hypothetical protein